MISVISQGHYQITTSGGATVGKVDGDYVVGFQTSTADGRKLGPFPTLDEALKGREGHKGNKDAARAVGKLVAEKALDNGIKQVVFDRGGYLYHGRVKELADGAREAGLQF